MPGLRRTSRLDVPQKEVRFDNMRITSGDLRMRSRLLEFISRPLGNIDTPVRQTVGMYPLSASGVVEIHVRSQKVIEARRCDLCLFSFAITGAVLIPTPQPECTLDKATW